jgi:hypothetical protein
LAIALLATRIKQFHDLFESREIERAKARFEATGKLFSLDHTFTKRRVRVRFQT